MIEQDPSAPAPTLDPALQQFLAGAGLDPNALMAPPQSSAPTQADLQASLLASAQAVSASYAGTMPWWAQGLRDSLISKAGFNSAYQADEGLVYLDSGHTSTLEPGTPPNKFATEMGTVPPVAGQGPSTDYALTVTQATNLPYTWDEQEVADAMKRLKQAGLQVDSFDMGSNSLVSLWGALVNRAAMTFALSDGKRKVTPWDVLDLYKSEASASGTGPFTGSKTTVQRNVTEITEGEAWSNIQNTLSSMLGRDPSDQETRDFTYRMNRMAAENPSISKTVTRYKSGEAVGSTTHTDPGFTSADMAQEAYDQAQNDPDYAEFRGASYLFNAMMSALGPIGG